MPKRKATRRKAKTTKKKPLKRRPVKKRAAPKRKKVVKRRPAKRVAKKKTTRASAKSGRRASPARKAIVAKAVKKATRKIGKTVHYYDRIRVAIVKLNAPLRVGDAVIFKRGETEHAQAITSMQIDHTPVTSAKKGDVVGVQVTQEIHEGAEVLPA